MNHNFYNNIEIGRIKQFTLQKISLIQNCLLPSSLAYRVKSRKPRVVCRSHRYAVRSRAEFSRTSIVYSAHVNFLATNLPSFVNLLATSIFQAWIFSRRYSEFPRSDCCFQFPTQLTISIFYHCSGLYIQVFPQLSIAPKLTRTLLTFRLFHTALISRLLLSSVDYSRPCLLQDWRVRLTATVSIFWVTAKLRLPVDLGGCP